MSRHVEKLSRPLSQAGCVLESVRIKSGSGAGRYLGGRDRFESNLVYRLSFKISRASQRNRVFFFFKKGNGSTEYHRNIHDI